MQITTDGTNYTAKINGVADSATDWNTWKEVTINLKYHDLKTTPTHIIFSCAASMYGDYFAGSKNSKMWIDKVELIYDENVAVK